MPKEDLRDPKYTNLHALQYSRNIFLSPARQITPLPPPSTLYPSPLLAKVTLQEINTTAPPVKETRAGGGGRRENIALKVSCKFIRVVNNMTKHERRHQRRVLNTKRAIHGTDYRHYNESSTHIGIDPPLPPSPPSPSSTWPHPSLRASSHF